MIMNQATTNDHESNMLTTNDHETRNHQIVIQLNPSQVQRHINYVSVVKDSHRDTFQLYRVPSCAAMAPSLNLIHFIYSDCHLQCDHT